MKLPIFTLLLLFATVLVHAELKIAVFDADVTPLTGTTLTYDPMIGIGEVTLRARGYVITGADDPIVLCAVDWIGIGNAAHDAFRDALAEAAGTKRERVAVQALHQHDAPCADFTVADIMAKAERSAGEFDPAITQPGIDRTIEAVKTAMKQQQPLTHVSMGKAMVEKVASNRRVMGEDGKVKGVRYSATKDPELRAAPEGLIDPYVVAIGFWNGDQPVLVSYYYATHPMSYYRTGLANSDFPGMARIIREMDMPGVMQLYFTGAAGNITAGKYNDGAHQNRAILAKRLADGMRKAWEVAKKESITADDVSWAVEPVVLKPNMGEKLPGRAGTGLSAEELVAMIADKEVASEILSHLIGPACRLAWIRRYEAGEKIDVSCLRLGSARVIHLPGEPFVEYQLAAKKLRSDLTVAVAGYGNYGPAYIGTADDYGRGGYEMQVSLVGPDAEEVLINAMKALLKD